MRKIVDFPFLPSIGMELEDGAWNEPRKITNVCINTEGRPTYVSLGIENTVSQEPVEQVVEMYKAHGWKEPSLNDA